jgi:MFS family permease
MIAEIEKKKKRSRLYSIIDGTFYSGMVGMGESFFLAFAVLLKASNFQLGLLTAIPQFFGSIVQLGSSKVIKLFKTRKRAILIGAALEGAMYLPILLMFMFGQMTFNWLLLFVTLYLVFGKIISPIWNSWMGDLVDKDRGQYFGRRLRITGLATFITYLIAGFILESLQSVGIDKSGFIIIFFLAFLFRIGSIIFLSRQYEPRYRVEEKHKFRIWDFLLKPEFAEARKISYFLGLINFSVNIAAPFFAAYMLYDLKMGYISFTIVNAASILVKNLMIPIWGRFCDRFGNRKVLSFAAILIPVVPVLWLFSHNIVYLIFVQFFSGFVWAAWDIAAFDYLYDATTKKNRARVIAYTNVISGLAILVAPLVGGLIIQKTQLFWSDFLLVFLISGILRAVIVHFYLPHLKEFRKVKKITYERLFMKVISTMPNIGLRHDFLIFSEAMKPGRGRR